MRQKILFLLKAFIKSIYYRIIRNYDHIFNPIYINGDVHYHLYPIINLFNKNTFDLSNYQINELITYEMNGVFKKNIKDKIIESWVLHNNRTYTDNPYFVSSQRKKIYESKISKNFFIYKSKIILLPYYTNQAGHFIGEVLGSLLFFLEDLKKKNKGEKILIFSPSAKWLTFFKKEYPNNILFFSEKFMIENNIIFKKSVLVPKFSSWQNYLLAKNFLSKKIENQKYSNKKFFLTSERSSRISNIKELIKFLKKNNFTIINPYNYDPIELLRRINSAKVLITEKASISNNVHISRNKPYYILLSKSDLAINKRWYRFTGIYNNFHVGLTKAIYCENEPQNQNVLNFQHRIKVNIKELARTLSL